jgi:hypothetical protein
MRDEKRSWVWRLLGQTEELLPQLSGGVECSLGHRKQPQSPQGRKNLRGVPEVLTQLPCTPIGASHFRSPKAFGGDE